MGQQWDNGRCRMGLGGESIYSSSRWNPPARRQHPTHKLTHRAHTPRTLTAPQWYMTRVVSCGRRNGRCSRSPQSPSPSSSLSQSLFVVHHASNASAQKPLRSHRPGQMPRAQHTGRNGSRPSPSQARTIHYALYSTYVYALFSSPLYAPMHSYSYAPTTFSTSCYKVSVLDLLALVLVVRLNFPIAYPQCTPHAQRAPAALWALAAPRGVRDVRTVGRGRVGGAGLGRA
jgi:hypothetical protein